MSEGTQTGQTPAAPAPKAGKRSNWVIAHQIDGTVIKFTVKDAGEITLDVAAVSDAVRQRAAVHGLVQRVSDAAAIPRDEETGKSATPQEKLAAMTRLVEHYSSGAVEWTLNREGSGSGRGVSGAALLREALELWQPEKGAEAIGLWVKGLTNKQIAALIGSAELKPHVDAVREKHLKDQGAGVDAEELLSSL